MKLTKEVIEQNIKDVKVTENEPMAAHVTFKTGGPARIFAVPEAASAVKELVALCKKSGEDYFIMGKGSNLLVSDKGYDGVVICIGEGFNKAELIPGEGDIYVMKAQAGAGVVGLAAVAARAGLSGLEFASGIPGSLGGAVFMNAGAYGGEMKDIVLSVTVLDTDGNIKKIPGSEMGFGYRHSRVMEEDLIVLDASLRLVKGDRKAIGMKVNELMTKRREKQPLEYPSAGSTFKRPEGYFAGALIEQAGLRGYTVGGAQVSEKHCGFVINKSDATSADIMQLCRDVQEKVFKNSGVRLEMEVRTLGEF